MSRSDNILHDLIINQKRQIDVSKDNNVSKSYISLVNKRLNQLKYKPLIVNNKIVCLECKSLENLVIHHDHDTGQPIAIVCVSCNRKIKDKNIFHNRELNNIFYAKEEDNTYGNCEHISIMLREDQKEWLKGHPSINLSGTVQEVLDEIIFLYKSKNPTTIKDLKSK